MRKRRVRQPNRILGAAAILLGMLLFFFAAGRFLEREDAKNADSGALSGVSAVIMDPGHGGEDGGAVGAEGTVEKDLNLSIALKLRDLLELQGFTVYMTREEDVMTCDPGLEGITQRKKSDMHNRLALMDAHPEAVVLSIHQNLFEQARYSGAQMFYGKKNPWSKELAQCLQDAFASQLQPDNLRQIKQGEKDLYLLWESENPIVLVECGFLSNPEECANLRDEEYQSKVAFTILAGLMNWKSGGQ